MKTLLSIKGQASMRSDQLLALSVGAATLFATASSAQLPVEGAFSIAYAGSGKINCEFVGSGAIMFGEWDETGTIAGDGFLKGTAWRCYGAVECMQGTCDTPYSYCIGAQPDGDQIVFRLSVDRYLLNATTVGAIADSTIGTGKFKGVIASFHVTCRRDMTRPGEYTSN
jgi:hypothetical protein